MLRLFLDGMGWRTHALDGSPSPSFLGDSSIYRSSVGICWILLILLDQLLHQTSSPAFSMA